MSQEPSQLDLSGIQPPTPAELAFEDYLECVSDGQSVNTGIFVGQRPAPIRKELEQMIDSWKDLRGKFGAGPDLVEGSCSGGYQVLERLGQGGMGTVYSAKELESGREVALKVLSQEHRYSDEAWARFDREAILAAGINHARCVFVFGVTQFNERPAIAMERMTGGTLQDAIEQGEALPVQLAVDFILQVLQGLIAAHTAGVLHRDVKPSNCFFDESGGVKIGDFGISRCLEHHDPLTNTGQFLGSPHYAAPEQMRGEAVDQRTDVYSVGATLYALLTGTPPYPGKTLGDVIAKVLGDPVPLVRAKAGTVPSRLAKVLKRAMSKRPADRQENLEVLFDDLEGFGTAAQTQRQGQGLSLAMEGSRWSRFLRRFSGAIIRDRKHDDRVPGGTILTPTFKRMARTPKQVGPYRILAEVGESEAGRYLIGEEPNLKRRVWIHLYRDGFIPEPPRLNDDMQLRWISDGELDVQRWRVYEDPGGTRLRTYQVRKLHLNWPHVRTGLIRLCDHLDGPLPMTQLGQVWIDRQGEMRALEYSLGTRAEQHGGPREVLQAVATALLAMPDAEHRPRPDFAAELEPLVHQLIDPTLRFRNVSAARDQLIAAEDVPNELSAAQRYGPALLLAAFLILRPLGALTSEGGFQWLPGGLNRGNPFDFVFAAVVLASPLWAFLFRGGVWCSLSGLEVRMLKGGRASRLRCLFQSLGVWLSLIYAHGWLTPNGDTEVESYARLLLTPLLVIALPGCLLILGSPARTAAGRVIGVCFARAERRES